MVRPRDRGVRRSGGDRSGSADAPGRARWTREGGDLWTLDRLDAAGCSRYVVTDVASDGMLSGPNLDLLREVCGRTDAAVVASGGIAQLDDLRALRELVPLGVEGAIIGTALYVGNFTLTEALAVTG